MWICTHRGDKELKLTVSLQSERAIYLIIFRKIRISPPHLISHLWKSAKFSPDLCVMESYFSGCILTCCFTFVIIPAGVDFSGCLCPFAKVLHHADDVIFVRPLVNTALHRKNVSGLRVTALVKGLQWLRSASSAALKSAQGVEVSQFRLDAWLDALRSLGVINTPC